MTDFLKYWEEFQDVYVHRPVPKNSGGMGLNHSYALYFWLMEKKPPIIVESGVWKGATTWLIERACPSSKLFCFDIDFSNLRYTSPNARYIQADFNSFEWSSIDLSESLIIFDDHQNSLERLKSAFWFGFRYAVLDDNYPIGEGDAYSLNHIKLSAGMESFQLSKNFSGGPVARIRRKARERLFRQHYYLQTQLVKPNQVDWSNLTRNLVDWTEFPPLQLSEQTPGGQKWHQVNPQPQQTLLSSRPPGDFDFSYTFITLVELNRC
jgi:hypothetical protein